jgi:hypothetical protein
MTAGVKTDLRRADEISTTTLNRQPTVTIPTLPPLEGTLTGVMGLGDKIQLALIVGGARAWLTVDADTLIAVHRAEST